MQVGKVSLIKDMTLTSWCIRRTTECWQSWAVRRCCHSSTFPSDRAGREGSHALQRRAGRAESHAQPRGPKSRELTCIDGPGRRARSERRFLPKLWQTSRRRPSASLGCRVWPSKAAVPVQSTATLSNKREVSTTATIAIKIPLNCCSSFGPWWIPKASSTCATQSRRFSAQIVRRWDNFRISAFRARSRRCCASRPSPSPSRESATSGSSSPAEWLRSRVHREGS